MSKILYTDAHIYSEGRYKSSILCENGRILATFEPFDILPRDCDIVSLSGAWVYPGFVDTHTHSFEGGLYSMGADLSDAGSISDMQEILREAMRDLEKGETLFASRFDENTLIEGSFPSLKELDSLGTDHTIVLRRVDGHSCMLNSKARAEIPKLHKAGEILRGAENDLAVHHFHTNIPPDAILRAYHKAADLALKGGFTALHTMIGDAAQSNTHYALIKAHLKTFKIDYHIYPQSFNLDDALALGASRIGGCILADGSIGSHTAALTAPYLGKDTQGSLYQTDEFWWDFISRAHKAGLQVAVHCIGDRAIKQINDIYLKLQQDYPRDLRHELIHCELCSDQLLDEIAASGALAVVQPSFDYHWGAEGGLYEKCLGLERKAQMNRFRSMTERGIKLCFGSDWYVTELDALIGIYAAVNHHNPQERISGLEAVKAYTENAAYLSGEEQSSGKLAPGYKADMSIFNTDLLKSFELQQAKVLGVIKEGIVVYDSRFDTF